MNKDKEREWVWIAYSIRSFASWRLGNSLVRSLTIDTERRQYITLLASKAKSQ